MVRVIGLFSWNAASPGVFAMAQCAAQMFAITTVERDISVVGNE
jgi:hypothetical protein